MAVAWSTAAATASPADPPADDWPTAAPETAGLDSATLAELLTAIDEQDVPLHSLLLMRDGTIVLDAYHYPYDGSIYHDVASITKSVLTTLVGIAIDRGSLDLDAPVLSFCPERDPADDDPMRGRLTVRHLASMTGGFECIDQPEKITQAQMHASEDWVDFVLDLPMLAEPGTVFGYCDPGMHLLSAVLTEATGRSALDYARTELFGPLGIHYVCWPTDAQGYSHGWGDLAMKPRDLAKLGQLFLQGGRWGDEQVLPSGWVEQATTRQIATGRQEDYGFGWWVAPHDDPIDWFRADGDGGQRILVVPAVDVVVVATGGGYDWDPVVEGLGAVVSDDWGAMPDDPEGVTALAAAAAQLVQGPPASEPAPIPDAAMAATGVTWMFEPNPFVRSLRLDVDSPAEATLTLDMLTERDVRVDRVGLDGVARAGLHGRPIMATGRWIDERTLEIAIDEGPGFHSYTLRLRLDTDAIELDALGQTIEGVPIGEATDQP